MAGSRGLNEKMLDHWESFARDNAEYYILTTDTDHSSHEKRAAFFESGHVDVRRIVADVEPYLDRRHRALEIGCGVGRLAIPMSSHFDVVTAVDVAPTMLEKLTQNCSQLGVSNVEPALPDAAWDAAPVDLAYSRLVFQHIESWEIITDYMRRVAACLSPRGICHFQFDTRPRSPGYAARSFIPNAALPRRWRTGIRRVRRSPLQIRELFARCGLRLLNEEGRGGAHHTLILAHCG